jgi:hypothetical protein
VPPTDANTPIEYPGDRNTAVLRVEFEGGFVPPGVAFAELPALVVSGDMLVYEQGVTTQEFPGALVRPVQVRPITRAGIQRLLTLADEAGLLAPPPDYTGAQNVADAPDTVVTINAAGSTFVHRAYALGLDSDEQSPQRRALAEFVDAVSDVEAALGESGARGADDHGGRELPAPGAPCAGGRRGRDGPGTGSSGVAGLRGRDAP